MGPGGRVAGRIWSISLARMHTIQWMRKDLDISLAPIPQGQGIAKKVGSFVSNLPARWTVADEIEAMNEIDVPAAKLCRLEAIMLASSENELHVSAVCLGLTSGDGSEAAKIVRIRDEDEITVQELTANVDQVLAGVGAHKVAAISRVLWKSIMDASSSDSSHLSNFLGEVT